MFFSATTDTFWPLPIRVQAWSNRNRWDKGPLYSQAPEGLAADLRHLSCTSIIQKVEDIVWLKKRFPKLQTITRLMEDWTVVDSTSYKRYFDLQPEVDDVLVWEGLPELQRSNLQTRINRVSGPDFPWRLTNQEEEDVKLLRFRFEIQFVKSEVPELKSKSKYRRPKPKVAVEA